MSEEIIRKDDTLQRQYKKDFSIDHYELLKGEQKLFVDKLIWNYTFAQKDLLDTAIINMLYPKYANEIDKLPGSYIYKCFHGSPAYAGIIKSLEIKLENWPDESADLMSRILKDYKDNQEFYNRFVMISAVILSAVEFESSELSKLFSNFGVSLNEVKRVFGVKDVYYGGLGAYDQRWKKIRPICCSDDMSIRDVSVDNIIKNILSTVDGKQIFSDCLGMISANRFLLQSGYFLNEGVADISVNEGDSLNQSASSFEKSEIKSSIPLVENTDKAGDDLNQSASPLEESEIKSSIPLVENTDKADNSEIFKQYVGIKKYFESTSCSLMKKAIGFDMQYFTEKACSNRENQDFYIFIFLDLAVNYHKDNIESHLKQIELMNGNFSDIFGNTLFGIPLIKYLQIIKNEKLEEFLEKFNYQCTDDIQEQELNTINSIIDVFKATGHSDEISIEEIISFVNMERARIVEENNKRRK